MMAPLQPSEVKDLFARHSIRCTRQREDIYAALRASSSHPTADELFNAVRQSQPGMSLATVYNTLEIFTRQGLCRRLGTASGAGAPCRYDADLTDHSHLVTHDGRVCDLPDDLCREVLDHIPPDLVRRVEQAMGARIHRLSIDFIAAPTQGYPRSLEEN
jgi:Fur family peroxide stress response transcriptional regulator